MPKKSFPASSRPRRRRPPPEDWISGREVETLPDGRRVYGFRKEPRPPEQLWKQLPRVMAEAVVGILNSPPDMVNAFDCLPTLLPGYKPLEGNPYRLTRTIVETLKTEGIEGAYTQLLRVKDTVGAVDITVPLLGPPHSIPLDLCLWTVLTDQRLSSRLKRCEGCQTYFLDRTKNGSQKYCTPRCTSRVTSRRFRKKHRKPASVGSSPHARDERRRGSGRGYERSVR